MSSDLTHKTMPSGPRLENIDLSSVTKRTSDYTKVNKALISKIKTTIETSDELLEKDISNNKNKRNLVKIKRSMFPIVSNLKSEIKKIEDTGTYKLSKNLKSSLRKLNENLTELNDMFNQLY